MTNLQYKQINQINFILISLLPISFVIGPLIVELIVFFLISSFLYFNFKEKEFFYFKNKLFVFFLIFYLFLLFSLIFSEYYKETSINIIFYFRFLLFSFALSYILNYDLNYLKKIYVIFSITIFIVVFDGYWQFIFDENLTNFKKYRHDRISGFFKDDLVLGSFLSRLLPLHLGLILYFKKNKNLTFLNILLILFTVILIFLTGERAAFFKTIIFIFLIFFLIELNFKFKLYIFSILLISFFTFIFFNPIIFDRYYNQTKNQIFGNDNTGYFQYYSPMFETSLKMFKDNKIIGQGPKTYRYYCKDKKFVSYFPENIVIDNTTFQVTASWKELRNFEIIDFYISEGDKINKGDKLFTYRFTNDKKLNTLYSDKEGIFKKIFNKCYENTLKD